jgi:hypothetical protein
MMPKALQDYNLSLEVTRSQLQKLGLGYRTWPGYRNWAGLQKFGLATETWSNYKNSAQLQKHDPATETRSGYRNAAQRHKCGLTIETRPCYPHFLGITRRSCLEAHRS